MQAWNLCKTPKLPANFFKRVEILFSEVILLCYSIKWHVRNSQKESFKKNVKDNMDASYPGKKTALRFPALLYVYAITILQEKLTAQKF